MLQPAPLPNPSSPRSPNAPELPRSAPLERAALGASERMFASLRRFTPTNVARVIALDGVPSPAQLTRALDHLHARQPLLRARIALEGGGAFAHDRASPPALRWIERRDDVHWREVLQRALNTPIESDDGALFTLLCLTSTRGTRSELIAVADHTISDGVSMNRLCAELLEACTAGREVAVRPRWPVLEAMLPVYPWPTRVRHLAKALSALAGTSLLRALFERRRPAASTSYLTTELTAAETSGLRRRARLQGTSVTGALMAATLLAVRELRPTSPRLGLSVPIDLRPRLAHGPRPEDLGNYTSMAFLSSRAAGSAWELARALKLELERCTQPEPLLSTVASIYRWGRRLLRPRRAPLAHVMLSNSGLVPVQRRYGNLRVLGFFSADSAPMLSADFSFFCNTFDGRLWLNLVFSEQVVSCSEARTVLERTRALLRAMSA